MSGTAKHLKALKRQKRKGKRAKELRQLKRHRPVLDVDAARLREFAARLGLV